MIKSVLIIEDSRSFASLVAGTLMHRHRHESVIADTLAKAKELLEEHGDDFIAAVVDLNLPDAPHGEAVELTSDFNIPSVVFTGQISEGLREDIFSKGVSDYVLKAGQHSIDYVVDAVHRFVCNRKVKVLVVDDSRTARRHMKRLLVTQCYNVIEAESGPEALAALEENPDISITITDCHMDGMNGFELTQTIRKARARETMAIVGVSSQGGSSITAQFIKSGADDFIVKPFLQEEFTCRINKNAETLEHFAHLKALNDQKNFLMGMAAHDIKNPLGIINRVVKRARNGNPSAERLTEYLSMVEDTTDNLLELLGEILEISRLEGKEIAINKEPNLIDSLLNERIQMVVPRSKEKNINIITEFSGEQSLPIDHARICQVTDNFLSNALKFSPPGSTVTVSFTTGKKEVTVNVCDEGPGVNADEETLLFEAFSQLSARPTDGESSTGLGLAICKSIVEAHDGTIGYQRLPDVGSRFYFSLPL